MNDSAAANTTTNVLQSSGITSMDTAGAPQSLSCTHNNGKYAMAHYIRAKNEPVKQGTPDSNLSPYPNAFSIFWLKSGYYHIGLQITYNKPEHLYNIYQNFVQSTLQSDYMNFGIDNHEFMIDGYDYSGYEEYPEYKKYSTYWFSSGEYFATFVGKPMTTEEILRVFYSIKANVKKTGFLSFGVDELEFSYIPDF